MGVLESWAITGKKSWLGIASEPVLRQLSTENGSNDDGGGGKPDARSTSGPCNSHRTDMTGSIHLDNIRIRNLDSHSHIDTPDNQILFLRPRFRLRPERQNAARARKPIRLPSKQLRALFSLHSLLPSLFVVLRGRKAPY